MYMLLFLQLLGRSGAQTYTAETKDMFVEVTIKGETVTTAPAQTGWWSYLVMVLVTIISIIFFFRTIKKRLVRVETVRIDRARRVRPETEYWKNVLQ